MTRMQCVDNSGAKMIQVIHVLRVGRRNGNVGDIVSCSIKNADPQSKKVKKGEVHRALIIRGKREPQREDGSYLRSGDTSCILLGPNMQPLGTRIRGFVSSSLDRSKYLKVLSMAKYVI